MADAPDGIVLRRHRDLVGRTWHPWLRRSLLALLAVISLLALLNVFGQRPSTSGTSAAAASVEVNAPRRVRGGLLFQARFTVRAHRELKEANLVLGQGWFDGLTVNTIEPSPLNEASRNGDLALELGHIPAGMKYVLYVEYQVNPTTVGRKTQTVELDDGEQQILSFDQAITVYP